MFIMKFKKKSFFQHNKIDLFLETKINFLSSAVTVWKSYSRWRCFNVRNTTASILSPEGGVSANL